MADPFVRSALRRAIPGIQDVGNIDLNNRPVVRNSDGSISTVRSTSFNIDGREVLLPTVTDDGRILDERTDGGRREILDRYRHTGKHLGTFDAPDNATAYAESLHNQQAKQYVKHGVEDFYGWLESAASGLTGQSPATGDVASYLPAQEAKPVSYLDRLHGFRQGLPAGHPLKMPAGLLGAGLELADMFIGEPLRAIPRSYKLQEAVSSGDVSPEDARRAGSADALTVASLPMMGNLGARAVGAMPDNALGVGGGKMRDPLPMDHASRLERADAMYRPETVYHGTGADIKEFDLSRGGQSSGSRAGSLGVSLSPSPDDASEFAAAAAQKSEGGSSVLPLRYRSERQGNLHLIGDEKNLEVAGALQDAWDAGFDSVKLHNYTTPGGKSGAEVIVVRNPNQLRSVNAAFDPAKSDSPNILYSNAPEGSVVPLGVRGAQAAGESGDVMRLYHGGAPEGVKLSKEFAGTGKGGHGYWLDGLHFATNEKMASEYGHVRAVDLYAKPHEVLDYTKPISGSPFEGVLRELGLEDVESITRPGQPGSIRDAWTMALSRLKSAHARDVFNRAANEALHRAGAKAAKMGNDHYLVLDDDAIRPVQATGETLFSNPKEGAAIPLALRTAEQQPQGIRAFHGSPHDFDKFDASKIGSGEGAQAYGHGLYFAENEGVARKYKMVHGVSSNPELDQLLAQFGFDSGRVRIYLEKSVAEFDSSKFRGSPQHIFYQDLLEKVKRFEADDKGVAKGHLYEVSIKADPDQFLNWDKPLSEQNEAVRQAVKRISGDTFDVKPRWDANKDGYTVFDPKGSAVVQKHLKSPDGDMSALREAGIPGIKYKDAGSRGKEGEGTSNYVIFPGNEHLISIVKKYGIAGAATMLGMSQSDLAKAMDDAGSAASRKFASRGFQDRMHGNGFAVPKPGGRAPSSPSEFAMALSELHGDDFNTWLETESKKFASSKR